MTQHHHHHPMPSFSSVLILLTCADVLRQRRSTVLLLGVPHCDSACFFMLGATRIPSANLQMSALRLQDLYCVLQCCAVPLLRFSKIVRFARARSCVRGSLRSSASSTVHGVVCDVWVMFLPRQGPHDDGHLPSHVVRSSDVLQLLGYRHVD